MRNLVFLYFVTVIAQTLGDIVFLIKINICHVFPILYYFLNK